MAPRAFLFDVDGSLLDSVSMHAVAWVEALANLGFRFEREVLQGLVGMGGQQLMATLLGEAGGAGAARDAPRLQAVIFKDRHISQVRPFPKAIALLEALNERGIRTGLVSAADDEVLDQYVEMFDLGHLVSVTVSGNEVPSGMPDPDLYVLALRRLVLESEEAWVVGDSPWDIEAATKAGLESLAILSGGYARPSLAGARGIFKDPADLLENLDSLLASAS